MNFCATPQSRGTNAAPGRYNACPLTILTEVRVMTFKQFILLGVATLALAPATLASQGIDDSKITASGRGETSLLVQTGDGVKEPQNRRATIDLQ